MLRALAKQSASDATAADRAAAAQRLAAAQKDLASTADPAEKQAAEPGNAPEVTTSIAKEAAVASADGSGSLISAVQTCNKAKQLSEAATGATGAKTCVKAALVDLSTQLTSERTALADRSTLVLDKGELKGGAPAGYRQYIPLFSGFKIDASDRTAAWAGAGAWLVAGVDGLRWSRNLGIVLGDVLGSVVMAWVLRGLWMPRGAMKRLCRGASPFAGFWTNRQSQSRI